ncbi:hypothetical protein H6501_02765 [Candidatus Woesearchaeota archaeon]|nr:hypothetical protein [Nanoarchaeota archaeon]MCB9370493.1 hypothetical protein [Candidatus Woesearchaeota archaeon]USN43571.1 MAG: hypothetical protein H6500_04210 [Candidatus Woesearchaeota archaeon]
MKIEKTVKVQRRMKPLNILQYFIGAVILFLFLYGLIPGKYDDIFLYMLGAVTVQILLSLLRLRILNVVIELIILIFAIISGIPVLGYLFRLGGLILALLDLASFKSYVIYKTIKVRAFSSPWGKRNSEKKKVPTAAKDAEYKEK